MSVAVRLADVSKRFGDVVALDRASLEVGAGEIVAVLGPSGCGKTTLLRLVAGFERPDDGSVSIGERVMAGPGCWVAPHLREVGMVFQDYALFSHLTVAANIGFGLHRRERSERVRSLLELVGLDGLGGRYPHELSGGQQQRVAVARALAPQPRLVLMDEPWSNIDPGLRVAMRDELGAILRSAGATVLLVTHDRQEAFSLADRIALVRAGRLIQIGTAEELYFSPASRWAAEFVGAATVLKGEVDGDHVRTPVGSVTMSGQVHRGEVAVVLRPEQVKLRAAEHGRAVVISRDFRGHHVFYGVQLEAQHLLSQHASSERMEIGARVDVSLAGDDVVILSAGETI